MPQDHKEPKVPKERHKELKVQQELKGQQELKVVLVLLQGLKEL